LGDNGVFREEGVMSTGRQTSRTAAAGLLASVMPDSMSDIVDSERCFITIRNGSPPGIRSHCAVAGYVDDLSDDGIPSNSMTNRARIYVATASGYFHEWSLVVGPGREGTCSLERECALLSSASDDEISAQFV
jgi:hypothetical protein